LQEVRLWGKWNGFINCMNCRVRRTSSCRHYQSNFVIKTIDCITAEGCVSLTVYPSEELNAAE
jgi:hypothetical protein